MEGLVLLRATPKISFHSINHKPSFSIRGSIPTAQTSTTMCIHYFHLIQAKLDENAENALKVKEWEVGMFQNEMAVSQGIKIRRRSPTEPPTHYVGPFEFQLQNEGNTPRNILEEIVWNKDVEVTKMKERMPFKGVLRENFDPVEIAKAYEKGGAACLSVLTDEKYFQGGFKNLEAIRKAGIQCPLLCKEFIIDAWQIYYARTKGADAVLLIAAILPDLDIKHMTKICKMLNMAALVEKGLNLLVSIIVILKHLRLISITQRSFLKVSVAKVIHQKDIIVVGESALFTPDDIAYVQDAGVKASVAMLVLVRESIVKQDDPGKAISRLFGKDISL
ncbi:hypothetical protein SLE2022_119730 [Rubroshorea leprosula]